MKRYKDVFYFCHTYYYTTVFCPVKFYPKNDSSVLTGSVVHPILSKITPKGSTKDFENCKS